VNAVYRQHIGFEDQGYGFALRQQETEAQAGDCTKKITIAVALKVELISSQKSPFGPIYSTG